jgi:tRNA pseudouridine32 synthase / 23S rRNA pseudouridine746 synthase
MKNRRPAGPTSPEKSRAKPVTPSSPRDTLTIRAVVPRDYQGAAPDLLAAKSGLSKLRIKEAMQKGAVWITRGTRKPQRLRRVTSELRAGERLELYYDSALLSLEPPSARLIDDRRRYSVWDKPPGLLVEGSRYGDHATLAHQVANYFRPAREVFLVHRLDLEARGLMLIAHSSQAAAALSALFRERALDKGYQIEVLGYLGPAGTQGSITLPLDGKPCQTDYVVAANQVGVDRTTVEVSMRSGRYHQIRQHFALLGHPVMGDPKYGTGNSDPRGLRLCANRLGFIDPWEGQPRAYLLQDDVID